MAVIEVTPKVYECNGSTTIFPAGFIDIESLGLDALTDDLMTVIRYNDATNAEEELSYPTEYTISGTNVVTVATYPDNDKIAIIPEYDYKQETEFVEKQYIDPADIEKAHDKTTLNTQKNRNLVDRAMLLQITDDQTVDMELPRKEDRASKYLAFDSNGEPVATGDAAQEIALDDLLDKLQYEGDPISVTDQLIHVAGITDSLGNEAIEKKISWNPYEDWKSVGISGDLRWARGVAGVFGAYENLWNDPTLTSLSITQVGEWEKYENTTTVQGRATVQQTAQTKSFHQFRVKKGNYTSVTFEVVQSGVTVTAILTFATGGLAFFGGTFDVATATPIVAGEEYLITLIQTGAASGTDELRLYASSTGTSGHYAYYKDISYVGGIDYPVPYVKGTHAADSWVHPVTHEAAKTYYFNFKPVGFDGVIYIFKTGDTQNWIESVVNGTTLIVKTGKNGSNTQITKTGMLSQYYQLQLVYNSNSTVEAYLDSVLIGTISTNVPIYSDLEPSIHIGYDPTGSFNELQGYIADIMIRPSADTTTTHYDSGLPWTDPENNISHPKGYGLDQYGNMWVRRIHAAEDDAYSIVEQYTIGDQTVTKWSNGDMVIAGIETFTSIAFTTASGSQFRTASGSTIAISLLEQLSAGVTTVDVEMVGTTSANLASIRPWDKPTAASTSITTIGLSNTSQTVNVDVAYMIRGRWK